MGRCRDATRLRRRPWSADFRLHGGGHDLARAPTGSPHSPGLRTGSTLHRVCSEARPAPGFFVSVSMESTMTTTPQHFLNTQDWTRAQLDAVLAEAARLKREPLGDALKGKSIALVFFNASMRTRTSFELGAFQLGAHAVVLQPGKDAWPIEFDLGTVMDGEAEEHIAEVARVLSQYVDMIGVRAFPKFVDWAVDREDRVLKGFAKYATVPVINMETITHPCQE